MNLPEGALSAHPPGRGAAYGSAPATPEQVDEVARLAGEIARDARRSAERPRRLLAPWRIGMQRRTETPERTRWATPARAWSAARL